ncbi:hypothetical protein JG687_00005355 [Phytophthora cactorum]|uniref:Fibronectin type-III domain-containing protein n=1 Tax=Phytophthora cactorum TaxID=29920 RepID=A0A8T1UMC5_9STRA|nr:hypothetical protein JG687_00005355 [Phytophthora cactorum]
MRYRFDLALWTLIALLAIVNAFGDEIPTGKAEVLTHSDNAIATIDKNTRSFVAATHGSAYSLTLTTFLTDAAHLHYAVLPSGQPALDAAGVKSAAAQCRSDVQTVTVSKAQKVVSAVETLQPNTSYDVFFVAEVVASNGVFGPVQSVLQSSTHPEPPEIDIISVGSANATADTVLINATLTTLGRAYFALIPSGEDVQLTSEDLVQNRTTVTSAKSQFLVHTLGVNGSYNFQEIVEALTPATLYDVFIITEASGNGKVRSEVIHHPRKVRTHALAPEVTKVVCFPLNASATALDISFKLDVEQEDIDRVKPETLSYFTYDLHYEVIALSDGKKSTVTASTGSVSTGIGAATRSTDDISALKNTTIRGIFSMRNFSSVEDFQAGLKETHYANITGLQSGTLYKVKLRAETAGSNGLFGLRELTAQATTHEVPPRILAATVQATNKSVNSLTLTVDLEQQQGNIHYVLTGKSGATITLRSVFQQATSVEHLHNLLCDRSPRDSEENAYKSGVFTFFSEEKLTISENRKVLPNGARPGKPVENTEVETFRQQFEITGLEDATPYSIVLLPETTKSFGLFGRAFNNLLEAHTNENASEVELRSARPLHGSITAIQLEVSMTKPKDILFLCLDPPTSTTENDQDVTIDRCGEVDRNGLEASRVSPNTFTFTVGNLSEDTEYHLGLYAENSLQELRANMTYELFVVTETSRDGNSSGVLGELVTFNITTHAIAPKIVLATVDPVDGSTDSVVITANLSHPGMLHYFLSDVDFADPAIISNSDEKRTPHELRGQVEVLEEHILMEIINGTNDTRPTDPLVFVHNTTVRGLKAGTTYHVSLTTETYGSEGVFGEFPPPVLVNTHLGPPVIIPEKLSVHPVDGSSSALAIDFELDRFGDVHYALFFRGLVPDRSHEFDGPLEKVESKLEDAGNESISIWPPPISTFDLKNLNGSMLKEAKLEELGVGVWVNDTISVSREDITRGRMTHKEIDKLPANALFDVCLVSETAASGGILGWPSDGSVTACHRVVTHADYTNQSKVLDEISVHPIGGRTDGIRINLKVSKLLKAPQTTDGEVTSAFKDASPGHGDGVVAAGMLSNITRENATALVIEQEMVGLEANHKYLLFFAYETSGSNGVFTWINPHKHRGNDSRTENDGIPVTTYEAAPRIPKAKATPTFGQTSRTSYSLFIVSEALPADHGVYGAIHEVKDVSTFANAPILLAHAAYPTPGTTESLTVGFRMDAPGIVYFSAVAVKPWSLAHHVAKGSDRFGNRLALHDRLVAQKSLDVDKESMELESDSGWREMILQVPQTGVNYTVHLVTETKDSGGIYGTVATHAGVRAHSEATELVNVSVNPTDARVDALTVNITLRDRGHVHYVAVPSGRGSEPPSNDQSTELSVRASGRVDVNETTGDQKTGFVIAGLTEGTSYDLYFRSETFESFGVFGLWTKEAVTARTHGLPADVLPEAVECKVTPSCEQRGREACSRKANMCGKCLEGYGVEGDEEIPEANESCVKLTPDIKVKRGPKIKINGVTRNPNLHLSETESETQSEEEHEQEPDSMTRCKRLKN